MSTNTPTPSSTQAQHTLPTTLSAQGHNIAFYFALGLPSPHPNRHWIDVAPKESERADLVYTLKVSSS